MNGPKTLIVKTAKGEEACQVFTISKQRENPTITSRVRRNKKNTLDGPRDVSVFAFWFIFRAKNTPNTTCWNTSEKNMEIGSDTKTSLEMRWVLLNIWSTVVVSWFSPKTLSFCKSACGTLKSNRTSNGSGGSRECGLIAKRWRSWLKLEFGFLTNILHPASAPGWTFAKLSDYFQNSSRSTW